MSKSVRYKDGTRLMPGSEAFELYHNPPKGKTTTPQSTKPGSKEKASSLAQHMEDLDRVWRKQEGRKPVDQLTPRELMFEGKRPWDPALLKEEVLHVL